MFDGLVACEVDRLRHDCGSRRKSREDDRFSVIDKVLAFGTEGARFESFYKPMVVGTKTEDAGCRSVFPPTRNCRGCEKDLPKEFKKTYWEEIWIIDREESEKGENLLENGETGSIPANAARQRDQQY
ncbi:hypothetical protein TNCV_2607951 [Trichonephila clavipes]|uniref:Uncharacterized protein n=1 Tax=Trichonephila clavipes TaxID=2585209 RepID=A0A8X6V206_TRICX|nr:hypothetical protein TNCV_2607951 [Trichonephila clavipes]